MTPSELSVVLREGQGDFLRERRALLGLQLVASTAMGVVSLYQLGLIRHVPEPPLPGLDADKVDASAEAYAILATPDGVLGLASYAGTAVLAAMGSPDRSSARPWLPLALTAKVGVDALFGAKLTIDQWTKHRAFCSWCLLGAAASLASVPFAIPEARAALRAIGGR